MSARPPEILQRHDHPGQRPADLTSFNRKNRPEFPKAAGALVSWRRRQGCRRI